jgi:hypothetical protein
MTIHEEKRNVARPPTSHRWLGTNLQYRKLREKTYYFDRWQILSLVRNSYHYLPKDGVSKKENYLESMCSLLKPYVNNSETGVAGKRYVL